MRRYAIYTRVSTEEQSRPGHVSLEAQLDACREHVRKQDGVIACEEQDIQSGLDTNRPGYQRLKDAARRREIDAVIVWRLDRWGRDDGEALSSYDELERLGVAVESVMEPGDDPLLRRIKSVLSREESRTISQRTVMGLRAKARRGEWSGAPPLGYRIKGKTLALDPPLAVLVRRVFEEAASSKYSLKQLSESAKAAGLRGPSGHPISRQYLGRLLRNPTYTGTLTYGRQANGKFARRGRRPVEEWIVRPNAHPALVDKPLFDRVQAVLTRHKAEQGNARGTTFLLTSILWCGRCAGTPGPKGQPKDWRLYGHGSAKGRYYECSRRRCYGECDLPIIAAVGFEQFIKNSINRAIPLLLGPVIDTQEAVEGFRRHYEARFRAELARRKDSAAEERRQLEHTLEGHQRNRLKLARRHLGLDSDAVPETVYRALEHEEFEAIEMLQRALATTPEQDAADLELDIDMQLVGPEALGADHWRKLVLQFIKRVVVHDRGICEIIWKPSVEIAQQTFADIEADIQEQCRVSAPADWGK
jgi:site-specific DNA recombinase